MIGEKRLAFVCRKNSSHEVTPTRFFDITAFFISYLLNGSIDLLINHYKQNREAQVTCDQVWLQSPVWFRSYEMIYKKITKLPHFTLIKSNQSTPRSTSRAVVNTFNLQMLRHGVFERFPNMTII